MMRPFKQNVIRQESKISRSFLCSQGYSSMMILESTMMVSYILEILKTTHVEVELYVKFHATSQTFDSFFTWYLLINVQQRNELFSTDIFISKKSFKLITKKGN